MDKKQKMLLGVGVVALGAYLLFRSKKSAPALTASAPVSPAPPANLVGFDTGKFYDVQGGHVGVKDEAMFANAMGGAMGRTMGAEGVFTRMKKAAQPYLPQVYRPENASALKKKKAFANQPFNFSGGDNLVGDRMISFASANGGAPPQNEETLDGFSPRGRFFRPRTARYGSNEGTFKPVRKSPVEPNREVPVTQGAPLNNLVGADGGTFFAVHDGFMK